MCIACGIHLKWISTLKTHLIHVQTHPIKLAWDIFVAVLVIYVVMAVPYRIGYVSLWLYWS